MILLVRCCPTWLLLPVLVCCWEICCCCCCPVAEALSASAVTPNRGFKFWRCWSCLAAVSEFLLEVEVELMLLVTLATLSRLPVRDRRRGGEVIFVVRVVVCTVVVVWPPSRATLWTGANRPYFERHAKYLQPIYAQIQVTTKNSDRTINKQAFDIQVSSVTIIMVK